MVLRLLGNRYSPFAKRVEIALKLKGLEYEYVEQDIFSKSEELLKYNPIHKKVPVLIDDEKPICESLVIMEYIDELWNVNPLLPSDPYERAHARFWTKFLDDQLLSSFYNAVMKLCPEEEAEEALSIVEKAIKEKKVLGGEGMGYLEIVAATVFHWLPVLQEALDMELLTLEKHPAIFTWADELSAYSVVQETLPEKAKMVEQLRVKLPVIRAQLNASK